MQQMTDLNKVNCSPERGNFDSFSCNALALLSKNCNPKRAFMQEKTKSVYIKAIKMLNKHKDAHTRFPKTEA